MNVHEIVKVTLYWNILLEWPSNLWRANKLKTSNFNCSIKFSILGNIVIKYLMFSKNIYETDIWNIN